MLRNKVNCFYCLFLGKGIVGVIRCVCYFIFIEYNFVFLNFNFI